MMGQQRQAGQGLVEFALVIPIFLLVVFALLDVGRGVLTYNTLSDAARVGVREAIVNQDPDEIDAKVMQLTNAVGLGVAADKVNVSYDCTPPAIGCVATVSVEATYTPFTPFVVEILGPITMTTDSSMTVENT